jgi:hypothetical protein
MGSWFVGCTVLFHPMKVVRDVVIGCTSEDLQRGWLPPASDDPNG